MKARALTLVILLVAAAPAGAQVTGSISGPVTTPRPRAPQSTAPQAPAPGGDSQSTNPFFGSVPQGPPTPEPLSLSAKDAVDRALRNNLGLLLQEQSASAAGGARWRALAELLPNLTSGAQRDGGRSSTSRRTAFPRSRRSSGRSTSSTRACSCRSRCSTSAALNDAHAARHEREGREVRHQERPRPRRAGDGEPLSRSRRGRAAASTIGARAAGRPRTRCSSRRRT